MKKGISVILAVLLAVSCLTGLSGCGSSKKTTLYVYNWGQYISEGDDGSLDVIAAFEEAYPNIRVHQRIEFIVFETFNCHFGRC